MILYESNPPKTDKKDVEEVKEILKDIKDVKCSVPKDEDMLKWTPAELNAYIVKETKGMNISKKFKFGNDLIKRIKEAKAKAKKLNSQKN